MRQSDEIDLRESTDDKNVSSASYTMTEGERNFGGRHFKASVRKAQRRRRLTAFLVVMLLIAAAVVFTPGLRANIMALVDMEHPQGQSGVWRLAFEDDFDGNALTDSKWNSCYPGTAQRDGCTNPPEEQKYQAENASVSAGLLHLVANKGGSNGFDYNSALVHTGPNQKDVGDENKFSFKYGYAEARVKVPKGQGLWPAVWMLPADGSGPPEIDLLEVLGNDTKTSYATVHWALDQSSKSMTTVDNVDFADGFHTVGVKWSENSIEWFFDGQRVKRFVGKDQIPQTEMFMVANLAVGGAWPGSPNAQTAFPADFQIDWVRVWKPITG